MNLSETVLPLAVSLALGLLIGLERGWHERRTKEGKRVAGVRTFGLIGLLGGFVGLLAAASHLALVGYGFLGVAAVLIAGHLIGARQSEDVGVTSLIAGLLTFAFGAAATQGYMTEAAMGAVVATLVLGYKSRIHHWVDALAPGELRATLKLLAISVLAIPVLPDRGYGPWDAINPFEVWWMVVLIACVSFSGYFAMRIAGPGKGAMLTGVLAGLASSTALTLHFSRVARGAPQVSDILAPGILLACGVMFPRTLVIASIVNLQIFRALVTPALAMSAVLCACALYFWWRGRSSGSEGGATPLRNPLQLRPAILFGGLLAVIMVVAKALETAFGEAGIGALAAISGAADVDAIALTLSKMSRSEIAVELAAFGIVLAGAANSVVKGLMTLAIGGAGLGVRVVVPLTAAATLGLALVCSADSLVVFGAAQR